MTSTQVHDGHPHPITADAIGSQAYGRRPQRISVGTIGIYTFLIVAAAFFLLPLWIMLMTSFKPMEEIRLGNILMWPDAATYEPWVRAWSEACTGLDCRGLSVGFWNSVKILIPSVILSIAAGAVTGYTLSFWRVRGANLMFGLLLLGAFIPYQVFLYPLVRLFAATGIYNSFACIVLVHVIFGLPIMTLLFRNYYAGLPIELFKAARVDGGGFWSIFTMIILPMSTPILIVAAILQVTGIWNDFLFGLTFAGRENLPMTVQLNNIVGSQQGQREYNTEMAATVLTAAVPLFVYFISGRWFVRGIASGAVKG
jgi:glucose/mannose transport system permease protein